MIRAALAAGLALLSACGLPPSADATPEAAAAAAHRAPGPPSLTLFTMVSTRDGSGSHTALMVSGRAERIVFDPAGTFAHPAAPERGDVLHGIDDRMLELFVDYHARPLFDVEMRTLPLDGATADRLIALARARGPVPRIRCALATGALLRDAGVPGMRPRLYPDALARDLDRRPGVVRTRRADPTPDAWSPERRDAPPPPAA